MSKSFDINNLNDLDFNNMGSWPTVAKVVVALLVVAVVLGGGYWLLIQDAWTELESVEAQEVGLRQTFETKQAKAANLDAYREQMQIMEEHFGTLLRQLPKKTEVPGLLEDISYVGSTSGLEFDKIFLDNESRVQFYSELPIKIQVRGTYHQIGKFISEVAALPRIVTLHDFSLRADGKKQEKPSGDVKFKTEQQLLMEITAKTYRYETEAVVSKGAKQ